MLKKFIEDNGLKNVVTVGSKWSEDKDFKQYGQVLSRVDNRVISLTLYAREQSKTIDCLIINGMRPHSDAMNCLKAIEPALKDGCKIVLVGTLPNSEVDTLFNDGPYIGELFKTALDLSQVCDIKTYTDNYGVTVAEYKGSVQHAKPLSDAYNYQSVKGVLKHKLNVEGQYSSPKPAEAPKPVVTEAAPQDEPEASSEASKEGKKKKRRRK